MRNGLFGAVLALLLVFVYQYCDHKFRGHETYFGDAGIIQQQLANVGKLVVTEGSFSQVHTYQDSKTVFFDYLKSDKTAIVLVNAQAQVAYDLSQLDIQIDTTGKKIILRSIPEPELKISPEFEFYDIDQGYFNPFTAEDFNTIKEEYSESLEQQIRKSSLMTNAQNRLISELQKIYILSSTMGWTLEYKNQQIDDQTSWQQLDI